MWPLTELTPGNKLNEMEKIKNIKYRYFPKHVIGGRL